MEVLQKRCMFVQGFGKKAPHDKGQVSRRDRAAARLLMSLEETWQSWNFELWHT